MPFIAIPLFIIGVIFLGINSNFSLINLLILFSSSVGVSLFISIALSTLSVLSDMSSATGRDISHIYFYKKNGLELMLTEETRLNKELSLPRIILPTDSYGDELRKKIENIRIKICLTKTELSLFEYY